MVDVTYTKLFNSSFGLCDEIDNILLKAQKECFANEQKGTKVTSEYLEKLQQRKGAQLSTITSPLLGTNTTDKDYEEAMYVIERLRENKCTTMLDLTRFWESGGNDSDDDNIPLQSLSKKHSLTKLGADLQEKLQRRTQKKM